MGTGDGEGFQGSKPLVCSLSMATDAEEGATHRGQERSRGRSKLLKGASGYRQETGGKFGKERHAEEIRPHVSEEMETIEDTVR